MDIFWRKHVKDSGRCSPLRSSIISALSESCAKKMKSCETTAVCHWRYGPPFFRHLQSFPIRYDDVKGNFVGHLSSDSQICCNIRRITPPLSALYFSAVAQNRTKHVVFQLRRKARGPRGVPLESHRVSKGHLGRVILSSDKKSSFHTEVQVDSMKFNRLISGRSSQSFDLQITESC